MVVWGSIPRMWQQIKAYHKKIFNRATKDTWRVLGLEEISAVKVIAWLITTLILYGIYEHKEAFDAIHLAIAGILTLVLMGVPTFLFQLFLAQIRIDKEQEIEILSLKQENLPQAKLSIEDDEYCVLLTDFTDPLGNKHSEAYYIRVRVDNNSVHQLSGLTVYLTDVQRREGETFKKTKFRTPLKIGGSDVIISKGFPHFFNVIYISSWDFKIRFESGLNEYKDVFSEPGFYKFVVQVTGTNFSQQISFGIDWNEDFERPHVIAL